MKHIVVVADMKVGRQGDVLVTHALGSCVGVMAHDPENKIGGMLHAMLPLSKINRQKAESNPYMFVDTGVPELFKELGRLGGDKKQFIVKVAGCSSPLGGNKMFKIGERNFMVVQKLLLKNNIPIESESIGGTFSRTVFFNISTGEINITIKGQQSGL